MQKVIRVLFNRVTLVTLAILVQIAILAVIIWRFSNYFVVFDVFFQVRKFECSVLFVTENTLRKG